jgi:glycosyltransferase involved in cell wall biosynthesis
MHDVLFSDFKDEFSFLYRLKRNFLFWLSANRCDILLTVSNYSREQISSRYKIPYDRIIVTPNGVSKDILEYESSKADSKKRVKNVYYLDKYVLYVSRVEPRKNQDLVLKWFDKSQLSSQGYKLVFVGKETIHTSFRRIVGSSKNVYWFEQVPYKDLLDLYNAASLFIYPAKAEGFGIPPLEAAAMETPVICSNATAMADFDFFAPYMFDPNSGIEKLDSLVISCLSNISQSRVSSIKSQIANRYGWDRSVSILSSILSSN